MNKRNKKILTLGTSCFSIVAVPALAFGFTTSNDQNITFKLPISNPGDVIVTYTNNEIIDNGFLYGDGLQDVNGTLTFKQTINDKEVAIESSGLSFNVSPNSDVTLRIPDTILSPDKSTEYSVVEITSANLIETNSQANINHIILGTNLTTIADNTFLAGYTNVVSLDFLSMLPPFNSEAKATQIFGSNFGKAECQIYVPCNLLTDQYTPYEVGLANVQQASSFILSNIKSVSVDANKTVIRAGSEEKIKLDLIFTTRQNSKVKFDNLSAGKSYQQVVTWSSNNSDLCSLTINAENPTSAEFSATPNKEIYGTATIGATITPFGSKANEISILAVKNITVQAGSGSIDTQLSMIIGGSIIGGMVLVGAGTYTFFWWKKNKAKPKADKTDATPSDEVKKENIFKKGAKKTKEWFNGLFKKNKPVSLTPSIPADANSVAETPSTTIPADTNSVAETPSTTIPADTLK